MRAHTRTHTLTPTHTHWHTCVHYTTARILQPGQTCQRQSQSHFSRRINVRVCEWATITDSIFTPAEHLPPGTAPGVVSTGTRQDADVGSSSRTHAPGVARLWQKGTQVRRRSAIIIAIRGLFRQQNRPHKASSSDSHWCHPYVQQIHTQASSCICMLCKALTTTTRHFRCIKLYTNCRYPRQQPTPNRVG